MFPIRGLFLSLRRGFLPSSLREPREERTEEKPQRLCIAVTYMSSRLEPFLCNTALGGPGENFPSPPLLPSLFSLLAKQKFISPQFSLHKEEGNFLHSGIYIIIKYVYNMKQGKSAIKIDSFFYIIPARFSLFPPSLPPSTIHSLSESHKRSYTRSQHGNFFFPPPSVARFGFLKHLCWVLFSQGNGNFLSMYYEAS